MGPRSKREYADALRSRYQEATKKEKKDILNEFCTTCQFNRKYAIRLLNASAKKHFNAGRRGRKKQYTRPEILQVLRLVWIKTNLPCSKRLKAILPLWLPHYPYEIPKEVFDALLQISPATIDRLMKPERSRYGKTGLASTKPGTLIKKHIPIKTNQWDESRPGFLEVDSVAHCGSSTAGNFALTINSVDIATTWTEQRAVWGKGEQGVVKAMENIEQTLPFELLGFDCDNGSEFLNWHLVKHYLHRKKPVQFTRARPYYKNDNAHIEEKNWTHIRQYLGYQRFDKIELVDLLNDLYTHEWRLYFNFFMPSVKLMAKHRIGSKIIKKYDQPQTPLQRVLNSDKVTDDKKTRLIDLFNTLNPFVLQEQMLVKIKAILRKTNE
jgi:hypothetical protein